MKFVVLYHAPSSANEQIAKATPEQMKAGMDGWMTWAKKAGNAVVDLGMPLGNGKKLDASGENDSAATITGYSILQANSAEVVTELLKSHPHLRMQGFSIEVFEGLSMPGM